MKRRMGFLICLASCLCLAGCTASLPDRAADGTAWSDDWVTVGGIIGVDTPDGLTPRENNEALAANGMYYATWSVGEAEDYINADGDSAQLYDAQLYLLLAGYTDQDKAVDSAAEWLDLADDHYEVNSTETQTYGGQEFTVITYTFQSDTNPYARGASAFCVYRNYALSVELSCRDSFDGDPLGTLSDFLERCHYAA